MTFCMRLPLRVAVACLAGVAQIAAAQDLSSVRVATGLARPVFATAPPNDRDRLFVVEQHSGEVKILDLVTGILDHANPFLSVADLSTGNEQGLLGLAFHPSYASNGLFYIHRTRPDNLNDDPVDAASSNVIDEYQVSNDPNVALPEPTRELLVISQPQSNHNGGWLGFGPDGYLYIAVGDGGGSNDNGGGHSPGTGNAQDLSKLLGKILRIDVDSAGVGTVYAIPATNPFALAASGREIWAYGLRHPWRPSFDRLTGDLFIADVGQNTREEVNFQPASSEGGENYGWRLREGTIATPTGGVGGARPPGAIDPIHDYANDFPTQFAVIGGTVHRGPVAALQGSYVFGDNSGALWALDFDGSDPQDFDGTNFTNLRSLNSELTPDVGSISAISSFAEDADGNLYILDIEDGELFKIVPEPNSILAHFAALTALALLAKKRRYAQP